MGAFALAKPEWGVKRTCQSCGARFYDLKRDPIMCPKCGAEFDPQAWARSRRVRSSEKEAAKPKPTPEVVESEEDNLDSEDDTLIESDDDEGLDEGADVSGVGEKSDEQ